MDNLIQKYGKGAALLLRMGYVPGRGLGSRNQGILEPIIPVLREKGQGIKVNKMESRTIDDWSESEDDEIYERTPLGFSKGGDDLPDLWSLIHELQSMKIEFPKEVLGMEGEPVSVRVQLWQILKDNQSKRFRVDYLKVEVTNLEKSLIEIDRQHNILTDVIDLSNNSSVDRLLDYIFQLDPSNISDDIKEDVLDLVISKLVDPWTHSVEECDFTNLESFTQLIELGEKFNVCIKNLSNSLPIFHPDRSIINTPRVHLKLLESMLLIPLYHELINFYDEWDPTDTNIGIGVFEELVIDRELFSAVIVQKVIIDNLIVPRLLDYLNKDGNPLALIEWFTVITDMESNLKLIDSVFDCYIEKYSNGFRDYDELNKWLEIFPEKTFIFSKRIFIKLIVKMVEHYRLGDPFDLDNVTEFLRDCVGMLKSHAFESFSKRETTICSVVENELVVKLVTELKKVQHDEQVEFWEYWTSIINQYGLLNDGILKDIKYGWQFINNTRGIVINDGKPMKFEKTFNIDIIDVINKSGRQINNSSNRSDDLNISMKDIVMIECDRRGVSISPDRIINLGIQTFKVGDSLIIYFKDNVIWGSRRGSEYLPMGLEDIF